MRVFIFGPMKKIFSFAIAFLFILQIASKGLVWVSFQLNRRYVSEYLCEKKVPLCQGKCYLKKQLNKTEAQAFDLIKFKFEILYCCPLLVWDFSYCKIIKEFNPVPYSFSLGSEAINAIFHPPHPASLA